MKYTFIFSCTDNGGGHQSFEVRATDKQEAIEKGMKFAKKYACGLYDKILACCFDVLSICARIHERFQDWHQY